MALDLDLKLLEASLKTDHKLVEEIIMKGANPNAKYPETGETPLMNACRTGCVEVIEVMLKYGADPTATDKNGRTPLHHARSTHAATLLLMYPFVKIDTKDDGGCTPLARAIMNNNTLMVAYFIESGADINAKVDSMGNATMLHLAAMHSNEDIIQLLIDFGAIVDAKSAKLYTPLHCAAKYGNVKAAELLIKAGADIEATTHKWFTPLHLGATQPNITRALIDHGANIHARSHTYRTPLLYAADTPLSLDYMLQAKADPNAEDVFGKSALMAAVECGNAKSVQHLLDHNVLIRKSRKDYSSLNKAIDMKNHSIAAMIKVHLANRKRKREDDY